MVLLYLHLTVDLMSLHAVTAAASIEAGSVMAMMIVEMDLMKITLQLDLVVSLIQQYYDSDV